MSMIVKHIAYLLRSHNCVVVPGIGAFIAQRVDAYIDSAQHLIYPPARMLGFNAEIGHDDGLLASSVARQMNITYQQAQKTVSAEIESLRGLLIDNGQITLPRIGILNREEDGRITFEPFADNVVSASYLGLQPLNLVPVKSLSETGSVGKVAPVRNLTYRRWLKIAASIAVLLGMGGLLSTPVDLTDTQLASLGIMLTEPQQPDEEIMVPDFEIKQPSATARLNIAIPDETSLAVTTGHLATATDSGHGYYLIVASLPSERLAKKFIAEDGGNLNLKILDSDGRYRVYIATGSTPEETMAMLYTDDLSARYPDAWVYNSHSK